jgi:hypothetical protein
MTASSQDGLSTAKPTFRSAARRWVSQRLDLFYELFRIPDSARTLDDSAVEPYFISKWIGLSRSASWLWVTGAFRFLGEDFQTVTGRVALAVLPEFLFDNVVSPVWLARRDDTSGNRLRH